MEAVAEQADGGVVARILVRDPQWLVRLVLSLRGLVVVLAPDALRDAVGVAAEAALQGYDEPSTPRPEGT
jgi:predicted DNA-binding transcriptional regulator YafY